MIKKLSISVVILATVVGGGVLVAHYMYDVDISKTVSSFLQNKEDDEYTDKNLKSFNPAKVKGILKPSKVSPEQVGEARILYGNTLLTIPLPTTDIKDSFSDTVFATDGSFYIVTTKNSGDINKEDLVKSYIHNLGFNEPKVIEFKIPNKDIVLYIQCYTSESLAFFTSSNMGRMKHSTVKLDFNKSNDEIAAMTSINSNLIPKNEDMFIEDVYLNIVKNNQSSFEGYSDFITYEGKVFNYYRAIGFLSNRIKVEFSKLTEMGYTPLEVGTYKGVSYVKFKELILLGFPITNNSSLIYHVSN